MGKLKPGAESFAATEWNRHVDASDAYHRTKARGEGGAAFRGNGSDSNMAKVKNSSGADRREGEILEFTGLELTNLAGDIPLLWFTGGSPTLVNGFGVLLQATPQDIIDDCQISGVCRALVNVTDADHRYARMIASTYVLQSAGIGPVKILYKPPATTGELVCGVNLMGNVGEVFVKNDSGGDYAANSGPHDYKVMTGTPGSFSDTGQILSAYNIAAFKTGKMGTASLLEGIALACPHEQ